MRTRAHCTVQCTFGGVLHACIMHRLSKLWYHCASAHAMPAALLLPWSTGLSEVEQSLNKCSPGEPGLKQPCSANSEAVLLHTSWAALLSNDATCCSTSQSTHSCANNSTGWSACGPRGTTCMYKAVQANVFIALATCIAAPGDRPLKPSSWRLILVQLSLAVQVIAVYHSCYISPALTADGTAPGWLL